MRTSNHGSYRGPRRVARLATAAFGLSMGLLPPVAGADELRTITDASTGCVYVALSGALTPRLRRDGMPDCPNAAPSVRDQTITDLTREVATLRREIERRR